MTEVTERRVAHTELTRIVLACSRCSAEMTFDVENAEQLRALTRAHYSLACPFCEQVFDSNLAGSIKTFIAWHRQLQESGQTVYFRVTVSAR